MVTAIFFCINTIAVTIESQGSKEKSFTLAGCLDDLVHFNETG